MEDDDHGVDRAAEAEAGHYTHKINTAVEHGERTLHGRLTVEYAVDQRAVDEEALASYLAHIADEQAFAPEAFVEHVYRKIVHDVFPGYAARDEPWTVVPMLVSYEYGTGTGTTKHTVSLGGYL